MKKWLSTLLFFAGMLLALHPIRASAAAATTVTIGGITVSDGDYLAQDLSPATASNYALHFDSGTLTLRNAKDIPGISANGDLTLRLERSNSISGNVQVNGSLTIGGSGILTVKGSDSSGVGYHPHALKATGDITIQSGTVNITGGSVYYASTRSYAMYAKNIVITGGKVTVAAGPGDGAQSSSYGIYAENDIQITGGETVATFADCGGNGAVVAGFYAGNAMTVTDAVVTTYGSVNTSNQLKNYGIYAGNDLAVTNSTLSASCGNGTALQMTCHGIHASNVTLKDSTVTAKSGAASTGDAFPSYAVYSNTLKIIGGSFVAEPGTSSNEATDSRATFAAPDVNMGSTYYQWKTSAGASYTLSLNTPYQSSNYNTTNSFFCIKPMEGAITPRLRINSGTNEWEVSYNEGQDWQSLGVKAIGTDGMDGNTPRIDDITGTWWINGMDTGVSAIGKDGQNGKDGVNGKDGLDGKDGADGKDGKDGRDGSDGKDGIDGQNGLNGTDGKDGIAGKDGVDGKDGANGKDGADGRNGTDGRDGKDGLTPYIGANGNWCIGETDTGVAAIGKRGRDGKDGKDGKDGADGKDGVDGKDGKDGKDGRDGTGISATQINEDGCLILSLTDGTELNAGRVRTDEAKLSSLKTQTTAATVTGGISLGGLLGSLLYRFAKRKRIQDAL